MPQEHALSRTEMLLGPEALARLRRSHVAVLGLGGVGGYAVEALTRCGVGRLCIADYDRICITNLNRQILAMRDTVGRKKVEVMQDRILAIDPDIHVEARCVRVSVENIASILTPAPDYVVDALDTVSAKIAVAEFCSCRHIPLISCMGAGNKLDPTRFVVGDLFQTDVCPLAKVMRKELKKRGISKLQVVFSDEPPIKPDRASAPGCDGDTGNASRRQTPASIAFVPPVAGFILAGEVVRHLAFHDK